MRPHPLVRTLLICAIVAMMPHIIAGCSYIEKAPDEPAPARAALNIELSVPRIMRGTIASETIMLGYQPTIVRGYGLVVGLDGTGSSDIPPQLRAHMLAEMARHGIGSASSGLDIDPEEMLNSLDTAVVIVEGIIPPGAVGRRASHRHIQEGTRFDVRVYADPRSGTTSLEGGRLYTADMRPVQQGEILPNVGSRQAAALSTAGGPIFLNPFAEPGALQRDTANRTIGRIMDGGEVMKDMPIKLRLATPSHAKAEILQSTINARFIQESGQPDPTARGESDEAIRITVPPSYRDTPEDFVELLRHTTIRLSNAERVANSIKSVVMNDPSYAGDASWRWQALGQRALPTTRSLYDFSEELPRLAALRAGAKLGDALVVPHLVDMAKLASPESRRQAVMLLGEMPLDPRIDLELRSLLNDDDVDVRLSAYESLALRRDPHLTRYDVEGKFLLDVIDSEKPMIYITQIGQPRIAVFGRDLAVETPLLTSIWSGQLMLKAEENDQEIEVFYRPATSPVAAIHAIEPCLEEFIWFLGREMSVERPAPGLDLSYGQAVGVIYQIWRQQYIVADFKAEQDRVLAAILRQQTTSTVGERPEFSDPDFDYLLPQDSNQAPPPGEGSSSSQLAPPPDVGASRNEW